jgi:two-component system sensor histidine kinase GlrK
MTLRARLILTIGGVALLLVLPALYAAQQLSLLTDIASGTRNVHGQAYLAMGRFQARLAELDQLQRAVIVVPAPTTTAQRDTTLMRAREHLVNLATAGYSDVSRRASIHLDSIEASIERIDTLLAAGKRQEATAAYENVKPLFAESDVLLGRIAQEIDRRSDEDLDEAGRISAAALTTTLLALVGALFIAITLGAWTTRTVIRPIHRLRRAMAAVAAGEFVVPEGLPYDRSDEIGDLSRSFRAMTQHLADLDHMKADFMSVATHELKTPINVISGYAELMYEGMYGPLTPKQHDALMAVQEQSRNLTQLINQLLDISRLEAGGLRLEIDEIDVPEMMERLRRTFDGLAHKQHVQLLMHVAEDAPHRIPGDADRLRDQVFGNLLSNALKFTPAGGEIRVQAYGRNSHLVVEVSDTGPGIASDQLPHVFDKYYQIGEQARSKGAGLGLTIAHDVVEAHGGEVSVESVEGKGTTFRIALPTDREKVEDARTSLVAATQTER